MKGDYEVGFNKSKTSIVGWLFGLLYCCLLLCILGGVSGDTVGWICNHKVASSTPSWEAAVN